MVLLKNQPVKSIGDAAMLPEEYIDVGAGYCTNAKGRAQSWLCDSSSGSSGCPPFTQQSCAALCSADAGCTGFMLQNMSIYQKPPTCNLVTGRKPSSAGLWVEANAGNGLGITGHDTETRDHCFRRGSGPSPSPSPSLRGRRS